MHLGVGEAHSYHVLVFGVAMLTKSEKRLIEFFRSLVPKYDFNLSYFAKSRRINDSIKARASASSKGRPRASRSAKTE